MWFRKTKLHSSYEQRESATSYSTRKLRRIPRCLLSSFLGHTCHPPVLCLSSFFFPTKKKKTNNKIQHTKKGTKKKYSEKSAIGDVGREIATGADSISLSDGLVITIQPLHTPLWVWRQPVPTRASSPIHTHFPISSQADRFHGISNALNRKYPENVEILNPNPSPLPTFRATELRIRFSPPPRRKPQRKFQTGKKLDATGIVFSELGR